MLVSSERGLWGLQLAPGNFLTFVDRNSAQRRRKLADLCGSELSAAQIGNFLTFVERPYYAWWLQRVVTQATVCDIFRSEKTIADYLQHLIGL